MENFKIIYVSFLIMIGLASTYNVLKIVIEAYQSKSSVEGQSSEEKVKVSGKKKKNKQVKAVKQESQAKPSNPEVGEGQAKTQAAPSKSANSLSAACQKKVSKENGSLTSSLLKEKVPAKGKSKGRKLQGIQQRSSSETSSSSGEGQDLSVKGKARDQNFCSESLYSGSKLPSKPILDENKCGQAVPQYDEKPNSNRTERRSRSDNVKPHQTHLDQQTSHQSHLVDRLVHSLCPQSTDPTFNLTQKSKILTIIQENNHQEEVPSGGGQNIDTEKDRSGFLLGSAALPPPSDSLLFVPGQQVSKTSTDKTDVEVKNETPTLEYKCGAKSSSSKDLLTKVEGHSKEEPVDLDLQPITSPLTRILIKEIDNYPATDVDKATKEVLLYTNIEDLTIPEFQKIVVEKLEKEKQEKSKDIYISDESEDEEEEECHICLGSLEEEVEVLEGCGHIFHASCISSWVARKESEKIIASCPKCRAAI